MDVLELKHSIIKEIEKKDLSKMCRLFALWREHQGFETNWECMPKKLMLVVTELAEAMEEWRIDNRLSFNVEIADAVIRLLDICGSLDINISCEMRNKMMVNFTRPKLHGKKA